MRAWTNGASCQPGRAIVRVAKWVLSFLMRRARIPSRIEDRPIPLPPLDVTVALKRAVKPHEFAAPNPWLQATARVPNEGQVVGTASFCVSPLNDRIYLSSMEIAETHRRRHYGAALVDAIARHQAGASPLPVTPIQEWETAEVFWGALRAGRVRGLIVTEQIGMSEMPAESARWKTDG